MEAIIDHFKEIIVQIATPYSTGTGFYIKQYGLIVTNEHVVRDNKEVVIEGAKFNRQISKVIYLDSFYDLAFLEAPDDIDVANSKFGAMGAQMVGDQVLAIGHPFGLDYTTTQGILSNVSYEQNHVKYYQHDAALNPGNSGGPLISPLGEILGVNTFIIRDGKNIGFSLPSETLQEILEEFSKTEEGHATRCEACRKLAFEKLTQNEYCNHCGARLSFIRDIEEYEPVGIHKTIENLLGGMGYEMKLSRKGPNNWEIRKGSADINVSYHGKTGLIVGDASLCILPENNVLEIYKYLLQQNYVLEGLTFSIKGQYIIISLLLYDQYLKADSASHLFRQLFEAADYFDNILMDNFGAKPV